jgi:hypothetical protein
MKAAAIFGELARPMIFVFLGSTLCRQKQKEKRTGFLLSRMVCILLTDLFVYQFPKLHPYDN